MEVVKKLFDTTDLYAILNIAKDKSADGKALKAAYLRAALKTHPDKGPQEEREERTQKFQVVKQIYELLQDDDMRKAYNETGEWPDKEEFSLDTASFGRLDEETILDFKKTYLGSEEEREDVEKLYKEGKGDLIYVLDNLFFANILDDEDRVQGIIDDLIETGKIEKIKGKAVDAKAKAKKIAKAEKEAKEAEELRKELNLDGGLDSLRTAMAKNSAKRGGFLDNLEKKYATEEKNGKSKNGAGGSVKSKKNRGTDKNGDADEVDGEETPKSKKRKYGKFQPEPTTRSSRSRSSANAK